MASDTLQTQCRHIVDNCIMIFDTDGLGAKSENLSSVAPTGKRNSTDIMC